MNVKSHINDSKDYIITWIYDSPWMKIPISYIVKDADYIDFYWNNKELLEKNSFSYQDNFYIFSKINWNNKYSKRYLNCTWLVISWKNEKWENISALTHQNPWYFLSEKKINKNSDISYKEYFQKELEKYLDEITSKMLEWTIDIVIVWWEVYNNSNSEYKESIKFLNEIIYKKLNIISGINWWPTFHNNVSKIDNNKDIVVNTQERKVYYFKDRNTLIENINSTAERILEIL